MSNPLADMAKPDVIFCIGTNMTECHPVAATGLKKAMARGAKLIVADPRRIRLAELADVYLPIRVGSDVALLLAMAHVIDREGLANHEFIEARTAGWEEFRQHLKAFTPEWAAKICEVPAKDIESAALCYGRGKPGAIYYTLGITEHICGVDNVQSLCNLALMTGNLGVEGGGINPMRGQNNIQGCGDCGAETFVFPGSVPITDEAARDKFAAAYHRPDLDLGHAMTKVTGLQECGKSIRAMLIDGENTVISDPDKNHCEHALKALDHLVVIDIFMTETAQLAHVVLPATAWAETDGVACNTERRVQRLRAAVPPAGDSRPDWWIIAQIAKRLGIPGFDFQSPADVFNELCSLSPTYGGLDWDRVSRESLNWPVPTKDHPGTPILHVDNFTNGRGKFMRLGYRDPAEVVDAQFPVWLTTGRRLQSYHTRTQTGRSSGIDYLLSEESLEVNPEDAVAWGFQDGDWATVSSRRGSVKIKVRATDRSPRGTVFASFSFADVPVNNLTGSGYDPATHTAELKVCAVRIERATN
ncbi:MAG: formate dehydrogenase subunit alpha [Pedosphaera sp.]|nr:formate dehydrogenase subunit alpha [Pedosphaera sp.]MSU44041.1 formate dehydrogenase subunit alpha [Pedosphaera sp.]